MKRSHPHPHWQSIALDLLEDKDTLAGLAYTNRVSIDQILDWKEDLLQGLRHARRSSAA
jgi:hypothetical protein